MTETIYARVPSSVKKAAHEYAARHGMTLAAAVSDLLIKGIRANAEGRQCRNLNCGHCWPGEAMS